METSERDGSIRHTGCSEKSCLQLCRNERVCKTAPSVVKYVYDVEFVETLLQSNLVVCIRAFKVVDAFAQ